MATTNDGPPETNKIVSPNSGPIVRLEIIDGRFAFFVNQQSLIEVGAEFASIMERSLRAASRLLPPDNRNPIP